MMNFCTLFDSFYLDKAIALYHSLIRVTKDFHLYVFCFDEKSLNTIQDLKWSHATVLSHTVIEDEHLLRLKKERSKAEYCWTCTPVIIEYVLKAYDVQNCTYIDADLYFFSSPQLIFDEIQEAGAKVAIIEHRFKKDKNYSKNLFKAGKYCVEFNYFDQSPEAREALSWWKNQCLDWCYYKIEPDRMGDQKYLEKFPQKFKGVHEIQYLGAGVAPWNLDQYRLSNSPENLELCEKETGQAFRLVFYHFQNLRYLNDHIVNIKSQTHDKNLKRAIYIPYLKELVAVEKILKKQFGIQLRRKKQYSKNWLNTILQKYIVVLKITSLSDLINLKKF